MRILFLTRRFPLLSQTFVLDQIEYALAHGHQATVFCTVRLPRLDSPGQVRPAVYEELLYSFPLDLPLLRRLLGGVWRHPLRAVSALGLVLTGRMAPKAAVCALLMQDPPEIILANFGTNGLTGAQLKRWLFPRARLAVIFHGFDASSYPRRVGWGRYHAMAPWVNLAIAVNTPMAERLRREAGLEARLHYLGTHPAPAGNDEAVKYPEFTLLFVGRVTEKKGLPVLLQALVLLQARGLRVPLRVIGDGEGLAHAKALATELGLAGQVVFTGARPHEAVLNEMRKVHALVAPSITAADGDEEGIPVTLMEAMAEGLPVISTFHAGIPELVENEVSGLLAPEKDVAGLAGLIERVAGSAELRARLSAAAVRRSRLFDADTQNGKLFGMLAELLPDADLPQDGSGSPRPMP